MSKNVEDILQSVHTIIKEEKTGSLMPGELRANSNNVVDQDELLERINNFLPASGWITCQSEVKLLLNEQQLITNTETGWILYGELCKEGISLHIRQNAMDGWTVSEITEVAGETDGIFETVKYITMPVFDQEKEGKPKEGELIYQVYWKPRPEGGFQKSLCRLLTVRPINQQQTGEENHGTN